MKYRFCIDMLRPPAPTPLPLGGPTRHAACTIAGRPLRWTCAWTLTGQHCQHQQPITLTINGASAQLEVEPWTTAARPPARAARPDRHQERVRPRPVRRVHRAARRQAHRVVPDARGHARRRRLTTIEGLPGTASCIPCSRPSSSTTRSSAATARPARSARRWGS